MRSYAKLLFLDVDGVLNSRSWFRSDFRKAMISPMGRERDIDSNAMDQLNRIVKETGCSVVLSSTWRRCRSLGENLRIFRNRGMTNETWKAFVGQTPVGDCRVGGLYTALIRGHEIHMWLKENGVSESSTIVILDDDDDMEPLMDRLVLTHGAEGLTKEIADEVIRRLNSGGNSIRTVTESEGFANVSAAAKQSEVLEVPIVLQGEEYKTSIKVQLKKVREARPTPNKVTFPAVHGELLSTEDLMGLIIQQYAIPADALAKEELTPPEDRTNSPHENETRPIP